MSVAIALIRTGGIGRFSFDFPFRFFSLDSGFISILNLSGNEM